MTEEQPAEEHLSNPQITNDTSMTLPKPISQSTLDDTVEKIKTKLVVVILRLLLSQGQLVLMLCLKVYIMVVLIMKLRGN